MAAGNSQWLGFIPGAKIGPVPVYDTFLKKDLQALLDRMGRERGDLSLKTDINVPTVRNKQKIRKNLFFGHLESHCQKATVRIQGSGSVSV